MSQHPDRRIPMNKTGIKIAGGTPHVVTLHHEQMKIEDGSGRTGRNRRQLNLAERNRLHEVALMSEVHLEEWIPSRITLRSQLLHQQFERHLLILHGFQEGIPFRTQNTTEWRIAGKIGAENYRIDEHPDQLFQFRTGSARDRRTD